MIRPGRDFEREFRLDAREAGEFLVAFGEPVELERDFEGAGEPELEVEIEPPGRSGEKAPNAD